MRYTIIVINRALISKTIPYLIRALQCPVNSRRREISDIYDVFCVCVCVCVGDYVKLNSPPDSLLEDSDNAFEMREMNRPAPPKTLALNSSTAFNSMSDAARPSTKAARSASAGRAAAAMAGRAEHAAAAVHRVKEYAVYLLGGTERDGSVTVFKKPMTVWKLSMYFKHV